LSRIGETPVADPPGSPVRSPGMMAKHYAPRAPLELADGDGLSRVESLIISGQNLGWLTWPAAGDVDRAIRIEMPVDPAGYAARLYAALHDLDSAGVDRIVVATPPDGEDWLAIHDRLRRMRES
jgi:L-threonylcarbamoyladenylate synthase